jgi:hypothetical protein
MWVRLCQEDIIARHAKARIRTSYQAVIHNILAVGEESHI